MDGFQTRPNQDFTIKSAFDKTNNLTDLETRFNRIYKAYQQYSVTSMVIEYIPAYNTVPSQFESGQGVVTFGVTSAWWLD